MKKAVLCLLVMLALLTPVTSQAYPIECADGFGTPDCIGALIIQWVLGGPWSGDWDVGGHNWDW